ncbi:MAG: type II secretion system GspH family protein [Planctomycetes bacterium]|nr:type II secretion system GspH family protein [Planctomycetota bacterium]
MTTCERRRPAARGFTLIELMVVLAVLGLMIATAVPLAGAVVDADRRQEVQRELAELGTALEAHWFDRAAFPATLRTAGFYGVHLQPGVRGTAVQDAFGGGQDYVYTIDVPNGIATVYSRGENGTDEGATAEEFVLQVHAAVPGLRRTWMRLRLIVELLADHIESGGSVAGPWPTLRAAIGLAADHDRDGFGTVFDWNATTHTLTSAGPDRVLGNGDDITL